MDQAAAGTELCTLQGVRVIQDPPDPGSGLSSFGVVHWVSDADVNADGSPHSYCSIQSQGLDYLANAGYPGNWWGIATNRTGVPFVQTSSDPAPGFYVSTTSYQRPQYSTFDPRRYLNSEVIPFIVVEGFIRRRAKGIVLGCKARVTNTLTNQTVDAMVGDLGPLYKIGEVSIAAAKAIGIDPNPRKGGEPRRVIKYEIWPGVPAAIGDETFRLIPAIPAALAA